jgi:uncharacterized phage protein (TIGR02220 family)
MSIRVMSRVWDSSRLGGTELLCLLAIADFANDDGVAYPSVATLAAKIRMSHRNTNYLLRKLEECGELQIERNAGPKGCNLFRVKSLQGANSAEVQSTAPGGATGFPKGVQPIAPEPSLNHQEPSCRALSTIAEEILSYLNQKAGRAYRPVKANIKLIVARLDEGATPEDCRAVIDAKVVAWSSNPQMKQYLRPETLFNATKFAQYVGDLGTRPASGGVEWE